MSLLKGASYNQPHGTHCVKAIGFWLYLPGAPSFKYDPYISGAPSTIGTACQAYLRGEPPAAEPLLSETSSSHAPYSY